MNKPLILNLVKRTDRLMFLKLRSNLNQDMVTDQTDRQLAELFLINHPESINEKPGRKEIDNYIKSIYGSVPKDKFGNWVYYPWNNHLVHVLPENLHTKLRTSRNRNLITQREQDKFYKSDIGITGLSVGNSVVAALAYTGGAKHLRLADHDNLSLSNLNRIRAGIWQAGLAKTEIAAQQVYEVNPYADIRLFNRGLTTGNLERFLLKPKKLDILIDEMDSLYLKIRVRILARKYKIPVIMATDNGDGILIDIERFDLEPHRSLFHGEIPERDLLRIPENISKNDAAKFIVRLVGPGNVAPRMTASLTELGKTLYTWPQLGTAAFLAGCVASYAARKIVCGEKIKQGKHLISFDDILLVGK